MGVTSLDSKKFCRTPRSITATMQFSVAGGEVIWYPRNMMETKKTAVMWAALVRVTTKRHISRKCLGVHVVPSFSAHTFIIVRCSVSYDHDFCGEQYPEEVGIKEPGRGYGPYAA